MTALVFRALFPFCGLGDDLATWAAAEVPRITRAVRHGGNLKYAWALNRRDRRHLPASLPYPKIDALRAGAGAEAA